MSSSPKSKVSFCDSFGIKPINGRTLVSHYIPLQGVISYTALSINVMNPSLVLRLFSKRDVTNILLGQTLLGSAMYLYSRSHLEDLPTKDKILYSSFGAVTFSLGSVLVWAILRSIVPQNVAIGTVCGIGSGFAMIKIARNYTEHIDSLVKKPVQ